MFKKKGLLRSQAGHAAGEGVAYLKSVSIGRLLRNIAGSFVNHSKPLWWLGMSSRPCIFLKDEAFY